MPLFRLAVITTIRQNMWILALLMMLLLPTILPYFTPHATASSLLAPARAQAAWETSWVLLLVWLLYQSCHLSHVNSKSTLSLYFQSRGTSSIKQLYEIWLSCCVFLFPLCLVPAIYCIAFTTPGDPVEAKLWIALNIQYSLLFFITGSSLSILAIALSSRFGTTIGYLITLGLALYGLHAVNLLDNMVILRDVAIVDWIYNISPQLHLANLTERIILKHGPLTTGTFALVASYLIGFKLFATATAFLTFTTKQNG